MRKEIDIVEAADFGRRTPANNPLAVQAREIARMVRERVEEVSASLGVDEDAVLSAVLALLSD